MKQKLALACTLIHQPPLLVLDEPTTGVDPVSRREFWKLLADFLASGLTIVMATPYLDEAERCGRVALLDEGRVLAEDTPDRLRADMSGVLLEVVASAARRALDALRITHGREVQLYGDRLHVRVAREDEAAAIRADLARQGLDDSSIRRVRPTLEDVFIDRLADARERAARAAGEAVTS
jgi:ABC-2 type transport system ATP-binding protein